MHRHPLLALVALLLAAAVAGCAAPEEDEPAGEEPAAGEDPGVDDAPDDGEPDAGEAGDFNLTSTAFDYGEPIPTDYTCDGANVSPPLEFRNVPEGTESIALIMDDPDAGAEPFLHWTFWNLPANVTDLAAGVNVAAVGGVEGSNDVGETGYAGPCPPSGTHRYFFAAYALDTSLAIEPGASEQAVRDALEGHVVAETELMGTYSRE